MSNKWKVVKMDWELGNREVMFLSRAGNLKVLFDRCSYIFYVDHYDDDDDVCIEVELCDLILQCQKNK